MEAISKEHEQWLRENTFECPALKARISLAQCEEIRQRPTIKEFANSGGEKFRANLKICRPEACDSCTLWKEFRGKKEEKEKKEKKTKKKDMAVCQRCGKEFKPYKHGVVTVKSICRQCLQEKKASTRLKNKYSKNKNNPFSQDILCSLLEREGIMDALKKRATEEIRTIEQQIVYELKKGMLQ